MVHLCLASFLGSRPTSACHPIRSSLLSCKLLWYRNWMLLGNVGRDADPVAVLLQRLSMQHACLLRGWSVVADPRTFGFLRFR